MGHAVNVAENIDWLEVYPEETFDRPRLSTPHALRDGPALSASLPGSKTNATAGLVPVERMTLALSLPPPVAAVARRWIPRSSAVVVHPTPPLPVDDYGTRFPSVVPLSPQLPTCGQAAQAPSWLTAHSSSAATPGSFGGGQRSGVIAMTGDSRHARSRRMRSPSSCRWQVL